MRVPICMQIQPGENGLTAVQSVLAYYKKFVPTEELRKHCNESRNGIAIDQLLSLANFYHLDGEISSVSFDNLKDIKLPCIITYKRRYYVVLTSINNKIAKIMDPNKGNVTLTVDKLRKDYSGQVLSLKPNKEFKKGGKKPTALNLLKDRLKNYKLSIFFFIVVDLAIALLGFFYAREVTKMLDIQETSNPDEQYKVLLIVLLSLFAGKVIFNIVKTLYNYKISRKMAANSTSDLFTRLLKLPASFYEEHALGELNDRLSNNSQVDKTLMTSLIPRVLDTGMCVVYVVLMFTYNVYLSIACLALEAFNFILVTLLHRKLAVVLRSQTSSSGNASSSAFNTFNNIETIKSMGKERFYFNLWNSTRNDYQDDQKRTRNLEFNIEIIVSFHNVIMATLFLFFGAYLITLGQFSLGKLYTFRSAFRYIKSGVTGILSTNKAIQRSRTYIERADDIKKREMEPSYHLNPNEEPNKLSCELEIKNLSYRYHSGDPYVLKNINLKVKQGEMIALVGSSGCGKTTLSKIISGIYKQTEGEVLYDGKKREEIPDIIFHASVNSVDQESCIFTDTISNNLKMFDDTVKDFEMILAARDAQIHSRIIQEPKGYDSMMQNNGGNFSGGEIQRIELARALSQEPTLLVLDEFTSALDAITEEKIFNAVRDKGTSAIVVAHRLSTIVNCDRIYVMDHGEIIEQGTHDELYALGGYYHQLVSKQ